MIAEDLSIDPVDIRLRNATQPGDVTISELRITSCGLSEALKRVAAKANWKDKRGKGSSQPGIGIACGGFVCGARFSSVSAGSALIKLDEDGEGVTLITGASDIGQGSDTILAQMVAEELGLTLGHIRVVALRQRTHKIFWLNPLLGSPSYQPLCKGIQAALLYIDYFLPAHNLESLINFSKRLGDLNIQSKL